MVAPIISGAMSLNVGWRNFWWLNVALTSLSFLMVLFMFPETKWHRAHPDDVLPTSLVSGTSDKEDVHTSEKIPYDANLQNVAAASSPVPEDTLEPAETAQDPWLGRGGPSKQQWKLFQSNAHPWKSIALDLWLPWKLFAFPIVEFASFVVSWSCSSFLTLNLTQTQAFAAPPYNFSTQSIGKCFSRRRSDCSALTLLFQVSPTLPFYLVLSLASQLPAHSATGSLPAQQRETTACVNRR